jgi:hypothetical protein
MSSSYSFTGCYQFDSASTIAAVCDELRELRDDEAEVPDPFDAGEIVIDRTEVRFAITGPRPSHWFEHYNTIVETFADRAGSGEVTVACDGQNEIYKAGPLGG